MVETYLTSTYHSASACLAFIAMFTEFNFPGQIYSNVKKLDYLLTTVTEFTFHHFLQLAFPTAPAPAISKMFEAVRDTSAVNEEDTVKAARREEMQLRAAEQIDWVKTMWPVWDSDGSGELDENEFKAIVQSIGASLKDAEHFFAQIDTDTSGTISMDEFLNWWLGRGTNSYPSFLNATF
ncbi:hypothetical protein CYMTET_12980 [Cymbomonas tetramitiformis]|uniref:EF-hand domain-containing protein n=1 Tax=Cymbomonas tetramitiformis TaxID=36881 RepID=A0AAE0LBI3_9CHLO|nr:hypothetical protein CYMTET_12980 [Cymbomonas tetramitiformis]